MPVEVIGIMVVQPWGPSSTVDAPYRWQWNRKGFGKYGYIVRWRARTQFLEAANEMVPDLLASLVTAQALQLASISCSAYRQVQYEAWVHPHEQLVEPMLFGRSDDLFKGVDWAEFDPEQNANVLELREDQQAYVKRLGREGIAQLWNAREVIYQDLGLPVWQSTEMYSRSESDGESESQWLRGISPELWQYVHGWTRAWHLDRPWVHMVAAATISAAAEAAQNGQATPARLVMPFSWEQWYVELLGEPGGPPTMKRPQRRSSSGDHLRWLIERHFMKRTAVRVASIHGVTQQTVDRETRKLAKMIGIDVLLANVGRKPNYCPRTIRVHRRPN